MTPQDANGLRVALLHPCFWPEVRRGSERTVRDLADGLLAGAHHPRLITSHRGRPARAVEDGLPIVRHWRPPAGRLRRRQYEDYLTHLPFSYVSLRLGEDDLAHAFYPTDGLVAARWSAHTGRPAVMTWMGTPHRSWLAGRRLRIRIALEALQGAAAVVAISRAAAAGFERWLGITPTRVIYPGVDLRAFAHSRARASAPTVFFAAALEEPRKRAGLLLEAFALVRRRYSDARLVMSMPRDQSVPAGLAIRGEGVELRNVDDRAVLTDAYSEAWVSVLPSTGEAFGLVLAESLACGTPVVATRDGGMPEIVDRPEIGRLFDGDDPQALAAALIGALALADDPATPGRCRARAEEFSLERSVAAYVALYRELLGAHLR